MFSSKYKSSLYNRFDVCFFYSSWFAARVQTAECKRVHKFPDLRLKPCILRAINADKYLKKGEYKIVHPFHLSSYCTIYYDYIFR